MSIEFTQTKQDKPNPNGSGRMLKLHIDGVWVFTAMQFDDEENGMRMSSHQRRGVIKELINLNSEIKIEVEEWE